MKMLSRTFDFITRRLWAVALIFVLNGLSLVILFSIEGRFQELTGSPVYDTQNDLTRDQIIAQRPLYEGEALDVYWAFAAFDFVFPLVGGMFFMLLYAFFLRRLPWVWAGWLWRGEFYLFALLTTLFDYLENVGFIATLISGQPPSEVAMQMAVIFKQLKLLSLTLTSPVAMALTAAFIVAWVSERRFPPIQR
ncbi:MAG: hypothetical protein MUF38_08680 [Anaerolineae bacterium]|nr:hypothetical protein [Anaerolineae bacterium]